MNKAITSANETGISWYYYLHVEWQSYGKCLRVKFYVK